MLNLLRFKPDGGLEGYVEYLRGEALVRGEPHPMDPGEVPA
jgi:hypothetical protein